MNAQNAQYEQQRTDALWSMLSQQGLGYNMLTSAVDHLQAMPPTF
ncbi:Uncharacterised protein [Hafnia alvei]|nr:Uncharacterised protein [Hafnia alvei]